MALQTNKRRRRVAATLACALGIAALALTVVSAAQAAKTRHLTFFMTPSHNIGCLMLNGEARCDIGSRSWSPPPRPASCPHIVDFGQGLELSTAGNAHFVCAGDTSRDPSAPILAYGQRSKRGALVCTSATNGVTCRSIRSGHGFFISKQRYSLF